MDSTGPVTRKRARIAVSEPPMEIARTAAPENLAEPSLFAVMQELQRIREEQSRQSLAFAEMSRWQDEEFGRLRDNMRQMQEEREEQQRVQHSETQLSPPVNHFSSRGRASRYANSEERDSRVPLADSRVLLSYSRMPPTDSNPPPLGIKFKPDTFDGTAPFREFVSQFEMIARVNRWDDATKAVALASSLRGKARSILESVEDLDSVGYSELKSKLELRFDEGGLSQDYYSQFTGRRQRFGEDFATFSAVRKIVSSGLFRMYLRAR